MKALLYLLPLLISSSSLAQFAIVSDADGYVNVRNEASLNGKIQHQLKNEHLIYYCYETIDNWVNVDYALQEDKPVNGYIYKNRLVSLDWYPNVPIRDYTDKYAVFNDGKIHIRIQTKTFNPNEHTLSYFDNTTMLELIDGKPFWGQDSGIPKTAYKEIKIQKENSSIVLPRKALDNLFEPNLGETICYYDKEKGIFYITAFNSDGAGGYVVVWKVEQGTYKERFVASGF